MLSIVSRVRFFSAGREQHRCWKKKEQKKKEREKNDDVLLHSHLILTQIEDTVEYRSNEHACNEIRL